MPRLPTKSKKKMIDKSSQTSFTTTTDTTNTTTMRLISSSSTRRSSWNNSRRESGPSSSSPHTTTTSSGSGSNASFARFCFMMALIPGITLQFMWISNKVIRIETICENAVQVPAQVQIQTQAQAQEQEQPLAAIGSPQPQGQNQAQIQQDWKELLDARAQAQQAQAQAQQAQAQLQAQVQQAQGLGQRPDQGGGQTVMAHEEGVQVAEHVVQQHAAAGVGGRRGGAPTKPPHMIRNKSKKLKSKGSRRRERNETRKRHRDEMRAKQQQQQSEEQQQEDGSEQPQPSQEANAGVETKVSNTMMQQVPHESQMFQPWQQQQPIPPSEIARQHSFIQKQIMISDVMANRYKPYHELAPLIKQKIDLQESELDRPLENSYTAYSQAKTKPVPNRKSCKETCCVEAVAIAMDQDDTRLINTEDGKEYADLWIAHTRKEEWMSYFASAFNEAIIPCMVPGTIIQIDNHQMAVKYFWLTVRPQIKVPFVLVTTASDDNTPSVYEKFIADPLLIAWYGTNPLRDHPKFHPDKFRPMRLGLSYQHPQSKFLTPYLEANNFRNPFEGSAAKKRFDLNQYPLDWDRDVFVHFGLNEPHRKRLWNILCPTNNTLPTVSCNQETNLLQTHDIYTDMSRGKYRFGISPTGYGWDCYRTYEMLLLGIIPIIHARPGSAELFEGLPVIHMEGLDQATSRLDFIQTIRNYMESPQFQQLLATSNIAPGWERMFTRYQRRQLLQDTGRDQEILFNKKGREFYQGYRYTTTTTATSKEVYCSDEGSCTYNDDDVDDESKAWQEPTLTTEERQWLTQWQQSQSQQQQQQQQDQATTTMTTSSSTTTKEE